jgi:N-acetylglucosaminyldiphosphoundecaprenol N-acetyl-beta-D-mannosaminyltransferase
MHTVVAPQPLPHAEILGIPVAISDYERTMDWLDTWVQSGAHGYATAAAVNLLMTAHEDPETMSAVRSATLVLPDGQPIVWALRSLGHGATRQYGPDLMALYCERSARTGRRMYLYGGRTPEALRILTETLERRYPGLSIVGGHSPPFTPPTAEEDARTAEEINRSGAEVVWVGTGQPKQELWMERLRPRLEAPMLIGVGAAFDFHAGLVPQAPRWMQRNGLEWSFRLVQEPRRLWRRYARHNPRFVAGFARQYMQARRHR